MCARAGAETEPETQRDREIDTERERETKKREKSIIGKGILKPVCPLIHEHPSTILLLFFLKKRQLPIKIQCT